jgi:hypothetical protein
MTLTTQICLFLARKVLGATLRESTGRNFLSEIEVALTEGFVKYRTSLIRSADFLALR